MRAKQQRHAPHTSRKAPEGLDGLVISDDDKRLRAEANNFRDQCQAMGVTLKELGRTIEHQTLLDRRFEALDAGDSTQLEQLFEFAKRYGRLQPDFLASVAEEGRTISNERKAVIQEQVATSLSACKGLLAHPVIEFVNDDTLTILEADLSQKLRSAAEARTVADLTPEALRAYSEQICEIPRTTQISIRNHLREKREKALNARLTRDQELLLTNRGEYRTLLNVLEPWLNTEGRSALPEAQKIGIRRWLGEFNLIGVDISANLRLLFSDREICNELLGAVQAINQLIDSQMESIGVPDSLRKIARNQLALRPQSDVAQMVNAINESAVPIDIRGRVFGASTEILTEPVESFVAVVSELEAYCRERDFQFMTRRFDPFDHPESFRDRQSIQIMGEAASIHGSNATELEKLHGREVSHAAQLLRKKHAPSTARLLAEAYMIGFLGRGFKQEVLSLDAITENLAQAGVIDESERFRVVEIRNALSLNCFTMTRSGLLEVALPDYFGIQTIYEPLVHLRNQAFRHSTLPNVIAPCGNGDGLDLLTPHRDVTETQYLRIHLNSLFAADSNLSNMVNSPYEFLHGTFTSTVGRGLSWIKMRLNKGINLQESCDNLDKIGSLGLNRHSNPTLAMNSLKNYGGVAGIERMAAITSAFSIASLLDIQYAIALSSKHLHAKQDLVRASAEEAGLPADDMISRIEEVYKLSARQMEQYRPQAVIGDMRRLGIREQIVPSLMHPELAAQREVLSRHLYPQLRALAELVQKENFLDLISDFLDHLDGIIEGERSHA